VSNPELDRAVRAWVEARIERLLADDELASWTDEIDETILRDVPEIDADPLMRTTLEASTSAALRIYVEQMPDLVPGSLAATPEMEDLGRGLAQRGLDVSVLLRGYRVGQRVFWSRLMTEINTDEMHQELRAALLDFLWDHLSRTLEYVVQDVVAAYVAETEQRMRGVFARRADIVAAILRGDPIDEESAGAQLSHRFNRPQVAMVLWTDDDDADDVAERLERVSRALAADLRLAPPVTVPSAGALWAWFAGAEPDVGGRERVAATLARFAARAALGDAGPGAEGFRASHEQAIRAYEVASRSTALGPVVHHREVVATSLLASDAEAMRAFVRAELGDLAGLDAATGRIRETVLAYLSEGSSARAAEQLTVHKNTVLYRLQQAVELLGRPLDERRFELEAALRLAATYGEDVLAD
jgi:DNA-binding PucR family transcriptional regulator